MSYPASKGPSSVTGHPYVPDISGWRLVHLIGIGGAGMSGIAHLLVSSGIAVTGSDLKESRGLDALRQAGARIFIGHREDQIGKPDAVVVSTAIPAENIELVEATRRGIAVVTRAQVLAALSRAQRTVAVAGTHGKTTTTSMITVMLSRLGLDPAYLIGAELNESGSSAGVGSGGVFVAETDESDGSFLLLHPWIGVVTNVDLDHLDFYGGREEIEAAFARFASQCQTVVVCWDDPGARRAVSGTARRMIRYGTDPDADVVIEREELTAAGARAVVGVAGRKVSIALSTPGSHNVLNAAASLAVASLLNLPLDEAADALRSFTGVRRRFELRGVARGARFVDDYAHNPAKVAAVLSTARLSRDRRVVAVFQPHRYSRTRAMWRSLGESLVGADVVVLTDVYGAGEPPIPGITGKLVVDALAEASPGKRVVYVPKRSDVAAFLANEVREGDLVVTIGAGDITMVGEEALARLRGDGE